MAHDAESARWRPIPPGWFPPALVASGLSCLRRLVRAFNRHQKGLPRPGRATAAPGAQPTDRQLCLYGRGSSGWVVLRSSSRALITSGSAADELTSADNSRCAFDWESFATHANWVFPRASPPKLTQCNLSASARPRSVGLDLRDPAAPVLPVKRGLNLGGSALHLPRCTRARLGVLTRT